jgi:hypothetical protein
MRKVVSIYVLFAMIVGSATEVLASKHTRKDPDFNIPKEILNDSKALRSFLSSRSTRGSDIGSDNEQKFNYQVVLDYVPRYPDWAKRNKKVIRVANEVKREVESRSNKAVWVPGDIPFGATLEQEQKFLEEQQELRAAAELANRNKPIDREPRQEDRLSADDESLRARGDASNGADDEDEMEVLIRRLREKAMMRNAKEAAPRRTYEEKDLEHAF